MQSFQTKLSCPSTL